MAFVDPYIDPEIGILRNLVGAKTRDELNRAEADLAYLRDYELYIEPEIIKRTNSFDELLAIHGYLFGDIYDWAGQIRTVDIWKNLGNGKTGVPFLIVSKINAAVGFVFGELKDDEYLHGLSLDKFVDRLAYFYDQLNYVHPFREGNGRTQRAFWSRVAFDAGYEIKWEMMSDGENDRASRLAADKLDLRLLKKMFDKIVIPNHGAETKISISKK
jgi:cell filamentation protein